MTDQAKPQPLVQHAVPGLDPVAASRWRQLRRHSSPWLHEEIGRRMQGRLDWIKQQPERWISWSPVLGGIEAHGLVAARYPKAQLGFMGEQLEQARLLLDGAASVGWRRWLRRLSAAARQDAVAPGAADLLWANMALHLYPQPQEVLGQWQAALRSGGLLMFSCLGPDTLRELRLLYAGADAWPPAHNMTDMHDWGDMLLQAGFAEPVMDMERLTLTYASAERMLADLRDWGRNLHAGRLSGTCARAYRERLLARMEAGLPRNADGQLCLTIEVIYGHAVKPAARAPVPASTVVSLQDMRALLRQRRRGAG